MLLFHCTCERNEAWVKCYHDNCHCHVSIGFGGLDFKLGKLTLDSRL
jgi:UDP-N-acetyl-D-mannosaminuronic acid transferase (WecB/TagA/CpsF family)